MLDSFIFLAGALVTASNLSNGSSKYSPSRIQKYMNFRAPGAHPGPMPELPYTFNDFPGWNIESVRHFLKTQPDALRRIRENRHNPPYRRPGFYESGKLSDRPTSFRTIPIEPIEQLSKTRVY
jgi:hypothetical protein